MDVVKQNQETVHCQILTDSGQTVEFSTRHSDRINRLYIVRKQAADRLQKTQVDIVTQNKQSFSVRHTESGQYVEDSNGHIDTEPKTAKCQVDRQWQTAEYISGHNDREPTEVQCEVDREWAEC